jgi:hypothetical protein
MEASAVNHGPGGDVEDGGVCGRCGQRRLGGTLARTGCHLYSLDHDNGIWAQLVQNGGAPAAQIARGACEGPPGGFQWAMRNVYIQ